MKTARIGRFIETALIAFFAGTVSCALTVLIASDSRPPVPSAALRGAQQDEGERVAESLARIETRISSLHTELMSQGHRRQPVVDSSIGETLAKILERLEAVGPDGAMRTQEATNEGWTSAIDKSLVRCLVQHAKTPYDEGVAPLLRQATQEIVAAEENFSRSRRLLQERNKQLLEAAKRAQVDVWTPPKEEQQALTAEHKARMDGIIARFRKAVAALDS